MVCLQLNRALLLLSLQKPAPDKAEPKAKALAAKVRAWGQWGRGEQGLCGQHCCFLKKRGSISGGRSVCAVYVFLSSVWFQAFGSYLSLFFFKHMA